MRFPIFRIISGGLLSALAVFSNAIANDTAAEFAIRWDPSAGGPATAAEVIKLLKLPPAEVEEFDVSYFTIATPPAVPEGYSVIARKRSNVEKTQLMIKYRGDSPLPDSYIATTWQCALGKGAVTKYEVDISFLSNEETRRAYSLSCSLKDKDQFPVNLNATQRGCTSKMVRHRSNDITIEEWTFYPGEEKRIEVSKSGHDNKNDFDEFVSEVSSKLILSDINPLSTSKSATGADCAG